RRGVRGRAAGRGGGAAGDGGGPAPFMSVRVMSARIHPAAFVDPAAELGVDVEIGPGTVVGPEVRVGDRTRVGAHALLTGWTRIGRDCRIHHAAVLGSPPQDLKFQGGRTGLVVG